MYAIAIFLLSICVSVGVRVCYVEVEGKQTYHGFR